jgi:hypothetical protein
MGKIKNDISHAYENNPLTRPEICLQILGFSACIFHLTRRGKIGVENW